MGFRIQLLLCGILISWPLCCDAGLQDPTRPANQEAAQPGHPELNAIIISSERRIAVVNGHFFHVGEQFEGLKVVEIDSNSVEIEGPSGTEKLTLVTNPIQPVR
jgi:hypothetical protein